MIRLVVIGAFLLQLTSGCANLAEKKPISRQPLVPLPLTEVNADEFARETQKTISNASSMTQVWWIPSEFWMAAFAKANPALAEQARSILQPYSMLAVVQADMSPTGGMAFYDKASIRERLEASFHTKAGEKASLPEATNPDMAMESLLMVLSPIVANAMGKMGQNMHFFILDMTGAATGARIASPYDSGTVSVTLAATKTIPRREFEFALPLNVLYKPRICPNGKKADVSWRYCPWDGSPL